MTITTIKLSQEINLLGRPTWVGFDGTITDGEDEIKGLMEMQDKVNKFLSEVEKNAPKPTWLPKPKPEVSDANKETIEAINNCQTTEELEGFWLISKNNLVLSEAYKTKKQQLTDAQ